MKRDSSNVVTWVEFERNIFHLPFFISHFPLPQFKANRGSAPSVRTKSLTYPAPSS